MVAGNPDKFAIIMEKVDDWCKDGFVNGLLYVYVSGEVFPKEYRRTPISTDLRGVQNYAFIKPPVDERLFALSDLALFDEIRRLRYPAQCAGDNEADEEYRFDIELNELADAGYELFAVSDGTNIRVLIGYWVDLENFELMNSVRIPLEEFTKIREDLRDYYRAEILGV